MFADAMGDREIQLDPNGVLVQPTRDVNPATVFLKSVGLCIIARVKKDPFRDGCCH